MGGVIVEEGRPVLTDVLDPTVTRDENFNRRCVGNRSVVRNEPALSQDGQQPFILTTVGGAGRNPA